MKLNSNKIKSLFLLSLLNSASGKSKKATNQSKIASPSGKKLNSLPKLATNLTEGENSDNQTMVFAGMPIVIRGENIVGDCYSWFCCSCK